MKFKATAFKWHPSKNQLIVSGTDADDGSLHLVLYDSLSKQTTDFTEGMKQWKNNVIKDL